MNIEKKAKITLTEYLIIKNSPNISFMKVIMIAIVFLNSDFNNRSNASLVSLFFKKLSDIYQTKKNELDSYFEALQILKDTNTIVENEFKMLATKDLTLSDSLSENQTKIIHELNKISDDVFYGMVIENV